MKKILILFLFLFSCSTAEQERQAAFNATVIDKFAQYDSAHAWNNSRLDDLEQEQTFQYKDIDSTKRALVWVGSQVIRHDTIIASGKSGLIRAEKRAKTWGIFIRTLLGR
jgi:hypothetical protein